MFFLNEYFFNGVFLIFRFFILVIVILENEALSYQIKNLIVVIFVILKYYSLPVHERESGDEMYLFCN